MSNEPPIPMPLLDSVRARYMDTKGLGGNQRAIDYRADVGYLLSLLTPTRDSDLIEKLNAELAATMHLAADPADGGLTYVDGLMRAIAIARRHGAANHTPSIQSDCALNGSGDQSVEVKGSEISVVAKPTEAMCNEARGFILGLDLNIRNWQDMEKHLDRGGYSCIPYVREMAAHGQGGHITKWDVADCIWQLMARALPVPIPEPVSRLAGLRDELDVIASASLEGQGVAGRLQAIITKIDEGRYVG